MRWVSGFDAQILEAMESKDPQVHYQAVCAAGNWGVEAAWPHVADLLCSPDTDKSLLLAAIEAAPAVRPREATAILMDLVDSGDEDIASAADEAVAMAEHLSDE